MNTLEVIIMAIVEGITEFLPISSTGHMIITQHIMKIEDTEFVRAFMVNIQFGAILSVVFIYWKKLFHSLEIYYKLFIAFLPAVVFGLLLNDVIDELMSSIVVVAISLILGGFVLLFVDKIFEKNQGKEISYKSAFIVGMFQTLAMIPGVSRSASTIIGGMTRGLSREKSAEFSFLLAIPTMFAASSYKLLKNYTIFDTSHYSMLILGNIIAFVVGFLAVKFFINFLTKHGFKVFGYYRIIIGLIILIIYYN